MDFKTNTSFNIANTSSHEDFDDDYILIYKDINNILNTNELRLLFTLINLYLTY